MGDPLPSKEALADAIRAVMRKGAGQPLWGKEKTDISALETVASGLVADPTLGASGQCKKAIELALFRLGESSYVDAIKRVLRLFDDETKYMAAMSARSKSANEEWRGVEASLEDPELRRMATVVAEAMLELAASRVSGEQQKEPTEDEDESDFYDEEPVPDKTVAGALTEGGATVTDDGEDDGKNAVAKPASIGLPKKRRYLLAGLPVAVLIVAAAVLLIRHLDSSPARSDPPRGRNLQAESRRALSLGRTPEPGRESPVLGFGDSAGGRPTYPYAERLSFPDRPVLNSLIEVPELLSSPRERAGDSFDEREFLSVGANPPHALIAPTFPSGRVAHLRPGGTLSVAVFLANDGWPGKRNCRAGLVQSATAKHVRVRVAIWNSDGGQFHVVRAWVEAGLPTFPTWITDAVAVTTVQKSTLRLQTRLSSVYRYLTGNQSVFHANSWRITSKSILNAAGMLLPPDGRLEPCNTGRRYVSLSFRQVPLG